MKTRFKKVFGMVLAILLVASPVLGAAALEAEPQEFSEFELNEQLVNTAPTVDCRGAFHTLYFNAGTPEQEVAMTLDGGSGTMDFLIEKVTADLGDFVEDILLYRWDSVADRVSSYLDILLGVTAFDKNGEPIHAMDGNLNDNRNQIELDWWRNVYSFDFDWRDDPMRQADALHAYIQLVKQKHGVDKVNLTAQSGSGHLGLAYLAKYGQDDLCGFMLRASLHNGSTVFGDAMNKRIKIDPDAVADATLYEDLGVSPEIQEKLVPILKVLRDTGVLRIVAETGNNSIEKAIDKVYKDAIIPILASQPVYWAYVPVPDYEDAIETIFGKDARGGEWKGLIAKLDNYHYNVKIRSDELLLETAAKLRTGIIANFGGPLFPVVENAYVNADILVDCAYASSGATVAPLGLKLGESRFSLCPKPYEQQNQDGHNHISPDNTIDASTCLLPETTWFFSGGTHFKINDGALANWFFKCPETPTVFTAPERFPQFLMRGDVEDAVVPMVAEEEETDAADIMLSILYGVIRVFLFALTWWIGFF